MREEKGMAVKHVPGEVPVSLSVAMAYLGEVDGADLERLVGPCGDRRHCPIIPGERWAKGKCDFDGCPRNMVHRIVTESQR